MYIFYILLKTGVESSLNLKNDKLKLFWNFNYINQYVRIIMTYFYYINWLHTN